MREQIIKLLVELIHCGSDDVEADAEKATGEILRLLGAWVVGECPDGWDGRPNFIQSWLPAEMVDDPDPGLPDHARGWCVSLVGKRVELRKGDKIVIMRKP